MDTACGFNFVGASAGAPRRDDEVVATVAEVPEVAADEEGAVDGADVEGLGPRVPLPRAAEGCGGALWWATRASDLAVLAFARVASVDGVGGAGRALTVEGLIPQAGSPQFLPRFCSCYGIAPIAYQVARASMSKK